MVPESLSLITKKKGRLINISTVCTIVNEINWTFHLQIISPMNIPITLRTLGSCIRRCNIEPHISIFIKFHSVCVKTTETKHLVFQCAEIMLRHHGNFLHFCISKNFTITKRSNIELLYRLHEPIIAMWWIRSWSIEIIN